LDRFAKVPSRCHQSFLQLWQWQWRFCQAFRVVAQNQRTWTQPPSTDSFSSELSRGAHTRVIFTIHSTYLYSSHLAPFDTSRQFKNGRWVEDALTAPQLGILAHLEQAASSVSRQQPSNTASGRELALSQPPSPQRTIFKGTGGQLPCLR
jgi:hypothetical protein